MISYELAKELHVADFPAAFPRECRDVHEHGKGACRFAAYPILSELIEACRALTTGRTIFLSCDADGLWHAATSAGGKIAFSNFNTAEEAVARLWLALHASGDVAA